MSTIATRQNELLQRVSKRHVVADIIDRLQAEREIEQEREDYQALKDIATSVGMMLMQRVSSNGDGVYVICEKIFSNVDEWTAVKNFEDLDEVKKYLINLKKQVDEDADLKAAMAENQTEREGM